MGDRLAQRFFCLHGLRTEPFRDSEVPITVNSLLKGFLIGFAIAAPVGPIGVLCIRRTLASGRLVGFLSGLGAATADLSYGAVAAFGLTAVQSLLVGSQFWLHLLGGAFLIYLGVRTFFAAVNTVSHSTPPATKLESRRSLLAAYISTFALTLTNPATIISFTVIFAGLRLVGTADNYYSAVLLVTGVFLGSATWWLTLSSLVGFVRERFNSTWMVWVNRLAGTLIVGFGILALTLQ